MNKFMKEWKENDGLRLLVWCFGGFFTIATLAVIIETLFFNPIGFPIGIC